MYTKQIHTANGLVQNRFEAFQLNLSSGCQVYHIAIPKACCNVSLIGVAPDDSNECAAPVAAVGSEQVAEPVVAEASSNQGQTWPDSISWSVCGQ